MNQHRFEAADVLVIDGQRLDGSQPQLMANLPGVLRGEGIFETFVVEDGVATPLLDRHAARLLHSAGLMGMDLGSQGLAEDLPQVLPHLTEGRWRVRYTVLRAHDRALLRMWTAGEIDAPPKSASLLLSRFRQDPLNPLAGAKTTSRATYQIAHHEAIRAQCFDALLPTTDGGLAECTSSNVFIWHDGVLRTPDLGQGILAGVTRELLLEACLKAQIPVCEQFIPQDILHSAQELYISNAVIGVIPIDKIVGVDCELAGLEGQQLVRLRAAYAAHLDPIRRSNRSPSDV